MQRFVAHNGVQVNALVLVVVSLAGVLAADPCRGHELVLRGWLNPSLQFLRLFCRSRGALQFLRLVCRNWGPLQFPRLTQLTHSVHSAHFIQRPLEASVGLWGLPRKPLRDPLRASKKTPKSIPRGPPKANALHGRANPYFHSV